MKLFLLVAFLMTLSSPVFATDTLRVFVLSPFKIEVSDGAKLRYNEIKELFEAERLQGKISKTKEIEANKTEYEQLPEYHKRMHQNILNFYDSVTVDNYISMVIREYIAYRLYRPFKIKPRLVFVTTVNAPQEIQQYAKLCGEHKNMFIINLPNMSIDLDSNSLIVTTTTELYAHDNKKILLSQIHTGTQTTTMTDMPLCSNDSWSCAFVNSVYPALYDCLNAIVEYQK